MNHPQAGKLEARARDLYLRAGPRVDAGTAGQLRAARRQVMADRQHHHPMRWMVPSGAIAAALLATVLVWQPLHPPTRTASMSAVSATSADATPALPPDAAQTDPTLYQNLDFYTWLAQQPTSTHATGKH